ncbi:RIB43A-like with coiled-coils protein 1 [Eumeta japonica]|uniref:RIB43A-like with coiled-coils protein 1 n=1 Tax=Eumeta variegata TaxID=151549 RepID=A0A4C1ZUV6_EUMVA|nr:RIB43A-like with coiled-coils protein 1 [Eumeta japonica]
MLTEPHLCDPPFPKPHSQTGSALASNTPYILTILREGMEYTGLHCIYLCIVVFTSTIKDDKQGSNEYTFRSDDDERRKKEDDENRSFAIVLFTDYTRRPDAKPTARKCLHNKDFNCIISRNLIAAEKRQLRAIGNQQEEADNTAEIFNNLTSDMLTENPDVAKSALGRTRAIGFMYKGMTKEERDTFLAAQKEQREKNKEKRDAELKMEAEWQTLAAALQREVTLKDIEEKRKRKELARQVMDENRLLALQQREKEHYHRELYRNVPTEAFYEQFNTTTR